MLLAVATQLSLVYPEKFVIDAMRQVRGETIIERFQSMSLSEEIEIAVASLITLGLPLLGVIAGLGVTSRLRPAIRFAIAAAGAFIGSLFVWVAWGAFLLCGLLYGRPNPYVF
ncbi:hypothetical protein [Actinoallomurus sp. CA-150999]|uniref:hypothetical protein n=1 Tax=Actinoallomurus sp. CA-150999 TaxID=3239887 RepID=UPI003D8F5D2A